MLTNQKLQRIISTILAAATALFALAIPVSAEEGMVFTMKAQRAENQVSEESYFDLKVQPEAQQTLELVIKNTSQREITVEVGTASASTTTIGQLDYTSVIEEDETLIHSLSSILTPQEKRVKIAANAEKVIRVDLNIPKEGFDGILLGGIRATDITDRLLRELETGVVEDKGIQLFIEYEHIIGVRIRENDNPVDPNFELVTIETGLSNYEPAIITGIRNSKPILVKGAVFAGGIFPKGNDESIFSIEGMKVEFAPNSVMKYEFVDKAGYGLSPGEYTFKGSIVYNEKTWSFEDDFIIEPEEASQINESAIGQQTQKIAGFSNWQIIIAGLILLLLLLLVLLLVKLLKKGK